MNTFQTLEAKLRSNINLVICMCHIKGQGIVALLEDVHGGDKETRTVLAKGSHTTVIGALLTLQARLQHHKVLLRGGMESDLDMFIMQGWMMEFLWGKEGDIRYEGRLIRQLHEPPTARLDKHIEGVLVALARRCSKPIDEEYFIEGSRRPVKIRALPSDCFAPIIDAQVTT